MNTALLPDLMFSCLHIPYVWGGNHPQQGFDCSGLVLWILRSIGSWDDSDSTAQGIYNQCKDDGCQSVKPEDAVTGDLVFFGRSTEEITHIGMIWKDQIMIEAGGGGRSSQTMSDARYTGAMVRMRHIDSRRDRVAIVSPSKLTLTP